MSETVPSCYDCVATIVTEQFTRMGKGVGTVCPVFLKEIKTIFPRIPELKLGPRTKTDIHKLLASWSCPELNIINITIHFQIMRI